MNPRIEIVELVELQVAANRRVRRSLECHISARGTLADCGEDNSLSAPPAASAHMVQEMRLPPRLFFRPMKNYSLTPSVRQLIVFRHWHGPPIKRILKGVRLPVHTILFDVWEQGRLYVPLYFIMLWVVYAIEVMSKSWCKKS